MSSRTCLSSLVSRLILVTLIFLFNIGKNGKTLFLLKESSKMRNENKRRKVINIMGTLKEYKA